MQQAQEEAQTFLLVYQKIFYKNAKFTFHVISHKMPWKKVTQKQQYSKHELCGCVIGVISFRVMLTLCRGMIQVNSITTRATDDHVSLCQKQTKLGCPGNAQTLQWQDTLFDKTPSRQTKNLHLKLHTLDKTLHMAFPYEQNFSHGFPNGQHLSHGFPNGQTPSHGLLNNNTLHMIYQKIKKHMVYT